MLKKLLLFLILIPGFTFAQTELTLPLLEGVYQSSRINPTAVPKHNLSIGIPGISSIGAGITNTGFTFNNIIKAKTDTALVLSVNQVIDHLKKNNFIYAGASVDLLHVRVKVKNFFFSAHAIEHVNVRFAYPLDFVKFTWKGNGEYIGQTIDWSKLALNAMHYREYAIGVLKYDETKKLSLGGRLKFLQGLGNVNWKNKALNLKTNGDMYQLSVASDGVINTSLPFNLNEDNSDTTTNAKEYLTNFRNRGLAFDVGASYQLNPKIKLSAALNNVGFIHWKTNPMNYQISGGTSFHGFDPVKELYKDSTRLNHYVDSLADHFEYTKTSDKYTTWLIPQLYLSGQYNLLENTTASASLVIEKYQSIRPALTLAVSQRVGNWFQGVLSYSVQYRSFANLGVALMLKPGPVQFYLAADNVARFWTKYNLDNSSFALPPNARFLNFRFGINLVFGKIAKTATEEPPARDRTIPSTIEE